MKTTTNGRVEARGGYMGTELERNEEEGLVKVRWDEDDSETWVWESELVLS